MSIKLHGKEKKGMNELALRTCYLHFLEKSFSEKKKSSKRFFFKFFEKYRVEYVTREQILSVRTCHRNNCLAKSIKRHFSRRIMGQEMII